MQEEQWGSTGQSCGVKGQFSYLSDAPLHESRNSLKGNNEYVKSSGQSTRSKAPLGRCRGPIPPRPCVQSSEYFLGGDNLAQELCPVDSGRI